MSRIATNLRIPRRSLVVALLFGAAPGLVPATAAAAEPPTVRVKLADLDLESARGQDTLAQRLRVAIDKVCADAGSTSSPITAPAEVRRCKEKAELSVQDQLKQRKLSPVLVARH